VVPLVAVFGLTWVAEHLVEVAVTCGACGVLAVAAAVAIMRWQDRRQAARGPLMTYRAEPTQIRRPPTDFVPRSIPPVQLAPHEAHWTAQMDQAADHPAIAPAPIHLHFHGLPDDEQAAVIRRAINGGTQ
jgi:hypothetical protein